MAKLKIKLFRSLIGWPKDQRVTVRALGLRKVNHEVSHDDSVAIRGMIHKVQHLIKVEEVQD